jgi:hypothetical protein
VPCFVVLDLTSSAYSIKYDVVRDPSLFVNNRLRMSDTVHFIVMDKQAYAPSAHSTCAHKKHKCPLQMHIS